MIHKKEKRLWANDLPENDKHKWLYLLRKIELWILTEYEIQKAMK